MLRLRQRKREKRSGNNVQLVCILGSFVSVFFLYSFQIERSRQLTSEVVMRLVLSHGWKNLEQGEKKEDEIKDWPTREDTGGFSYFLLLSCLSCERSNSSEHNDFRSISFSCLSWRHTFAIFFSLRLTEGKSSCIILTSILVLCLECLCHQSNVTLFGHFSCDGYSLFSANTWCASGKWSDKKQERCVVSRVIEDVEEMTQDTIKN